MFKWNKKESLFKQIIYYYRVRKCQRNYFDSIGLRYEKNRFPRVIKNEGYQSRIAKLKDIHKGETCTIICNGPSLSNIKSSSFGDTIKIGCNGIYKHFKKWSFETDYIFFEDSVQLDLRKKDLGKLKHTKKLAAVYNAYSIKYPNDWLFFNAPRCSNNNYYFTDETLYPQFSKDFSSVVHLGSTVTYIMLQFAYHIGCNPIFILGLDHDYGALPKLFKPGKLLVTEENYELVRQCHFDKDYYAIGDSIGVPNVHLQDKAYKLASNIFREKKVDVYNVSTISKLNCFDKITTNEFYNIVS
jgi:hypothetical protein